MADRPVHRARAPLASLLERSTASPLVRQARLARAARRICAGSASPRLAEQPLEWSCSDDAPAWSRSYLGYAARFRDDYTMDVSRGETTSVLRVRQAPVASAAHSEEARGSSDGGLSTGSTVWDAGIVLGRYAASLPRPGERCILLELGAGTGHVGLSAAACCTRGEERLAALVLTDLPAVLQLLLKNAERNAHTLPRGVRTAVLPYRWGDAADLAGIRAELSRVAAPFDTLRTICMGGDLIYRHEVVAPLVAALSALLLPTAAAGTPAGALATEAVISASMEHCPEAVACFVDVARAEGLAVTQVPFGELDSVYRMRSVVVLRVTCAR